MSDDLISKKAVIALIDKLGYINVSNRDNFNANLRMDKVRQEVVKLPTAFDKEKVIAELVNLRQKEYHDDDCEEELLDGEEIYDEGRSQGRFEAYHKAIEIVDKGGIEQ